MSFWHPEGRAHTNLWPDLNSSTVLQTCQLYGDESGHLLARISSARTAARYLTDRLGLVCDVVNYGGTVVLDQIAYDAKTSETTPTNGDRYGYDGYHFKAAIRLYYNQHR